MFYASAAASRQETINSEANDLPGPTHGNHGLVPAPRIDLRSIQAESRRKSHKLVPSVGLLGDFLTCR